MSERVISSTTFSTTIRMHLLVKWIGGQSAEGQSQEAQLQVKIYFTGSAKTFLHIPAEYHHSVAFVISPAGWNRSTGRGEGEKGRHDEQGGQGGGGRQGGGGHQGGRGR